MSMRVAALPNLTLRDTVVPEKEKDRKPLELLPTFDKFSPLTLWMPANTAGKGYTIYPVGLTFHLSADGITPAAGGGSLIPDLRIEKNLIDIPLYAYPIQGEAGAGNRVIVPGVEQYVFSPVAPPTNWYPRELPFELRLDEVGPSLSIDGDLRRLPFKGLAVDYGDRLAGAQRLVVVESDARHLTPGKSLRVRVRAIDTRPATAASNALKTAKNEKALTEQKRSAAQKRLADVEGALKSNHSEVDQKAAAMNVADVNDETKNAIQAELDGLKIKASELTAVIAPTAAEVEALTAKLDQMNPVLADLQTKVDATKAMNPLADAKAFARLRPYDGGDWKDIALKPTETPAEFDAVVPQLPDGIYRLDVGVQPSDESAKSLAVGSWVSLASERRFSIGLFTNRNRDSFYRGEGFWIGLGLQCVKSTIAAGTPVLVELVDPSGRRIPLHQQTIGAEIKQSETLIIRVAPEACLAWPRVTIALKQRWAPPRRARLRLTWSSPSR